MLVDHYLHPWQHPMDLHGADDPFKTQCSMCGAEIDTGQQRASDRWNNLYCGDVCKAAGLEYLIEEQADLPA